ncbi:MAG TPA: hypothetical protein VK101_04305 [Limnochordia bacterium]|nr:hypothetical protein [Limnochordia bacterium]
MRDLRLPVVVAVFLAVVAAGIGLRELYYQKRVIDPFSASAQAIGGVAAVELFPRGDGSNDVLLTLEPGAKIEEVYPQVEALARSILRGAYGRVVVKDDPTPRLVAAYHEIHFSVQQGISTGLFAEMAADIERRLQGEEGLAYRLAVGERHVFVHLTDGEGELYRVVPRAAALAALEPAVGGGGRAW